MSAPDIEMNGCSPFERLHPAVQYHVVNSLGWGSLRPSQLAAIEPILAGMDCLVLAPTAGGKTEAAMIPLLSRAQTEHWRGLTVLYVCPIKALLNNLEQRLSRYAALFGRSVQVWHGDIGQGAKARAMREPPDILLTTPESLEAMLISLRVEREAWFGDLRTVIVDELHAFAGDDRGWHLRAVLCRIDAYARVPLQRIGLSATVGNPQELLGWLVGHGTGVLVGEAAPSVDADVVVDFVGSLENAVTVISRLHRGSKRLVFCDSRGKVEQAAAGLRALGVRTFVSHSSLSVSERRSAEQAFAEENDCVIVATSTLELGIDVGDLDHVIQIDSPTSVSSFLQRMGRSGRRSGTRRNCTFLATSDDALLLACGVVGLWRAGFVEPVRAPAEPWHLVAQQSMAIVLETGGVPRIELLRRLRQLFPELEGRLVDSLLDHMVAVDILCAEDEVLAFGRRGEDLYGGQHFIDLVSSFESPPLLLARHGAAEIGYVDPMSLRRSPDDERPVVLLLGGRNWKVLDVEWSRRLVWVEPAGEGGNARWLGASRALSAAVCQSIQRAICEREIDVVLSRRATARMGALREGLPVFERGRTTVERLPEGRYHWWTFAGGAANRVLLMAAQGSAKRADDYGIEADGDPPAPEKLEDALGDGEEHRLADVPIEPKFADCLSLELRARYAAARFLDMDGAQAAIRMPRIQVTRP